MKPMYIASCSFGKDSIATILLALEHNEPLDRVVFAEVMFDHQRGISGEIPEHIEWIYSTGLSLFFRKRRQGGGQGRARYTASRLAANVSSIEIARLPPYDATWPSLRVATGRLVSALCSISELPPTSHNASTDSAREKFHYS